MEHLYNDNQTHVDWGDLICRLALDHWSEPDQRGQSEWRWGNKLGRKIDPDAGTWFDFESDYGGGTLDFVVGVIGAAPDRKAAFKWLLEHGYVEAEPHAKSRAAFAEEQARRAEARRERDALAAASAAKAQAIWDAAEPVCDVARAEGLVAAYLLQRGLAMVPILARVLPKQASWNLGVTGAPGYPSIVWPIVDLAGEVAAVEVVALFPNHGKAWRKTFGSPPRGGCTPLFMPDAATPLIVGEGVETVLSGIEATGFAGVACGSDGLLGDFVPPDGISEVIVAVDNDPAGLGALDKLAPRLLAQGIAVRRLCYSAKRKGYDWNDALRDGRDLAADIEAALYYEPEPGPEPQPDAEPEPDAEDEAASDPDPTAPAYSEEELGLQFASRHADDLRHVSVWGKWFHWTGALWREDTTQLAYHFARAVCRDTAAQLSKEASKDAPRQAKQLTRGMVGTSILRMAQADRRLAVEHDAFDRDKHLLNTPGGVIDLRSCSRLLFHDPKFMMSKTTSVTPGGDCPLWDQFLLRIFNGDEELIAFLYRFFGYCLTGEVTEQCFTFFHGSGANGKGTMLNTISYIFGDYHRKAPSELLMDSKYERHPQELASLVGARLVTTSEISRGRRWNVSRVKDLTGGDPITAHFMRKNDFTFMPQFGLAIAGNEKPSIPSVDEAIRRRLRLVPCLVTIPEADRDPDLADRLKAEAPGILRKLIAGPVEWYRDGLQTPASVRAASDEYLASEDKIGNWIAACCVREHDCRSPVPELYASWKEWAERGGEWVMTQTAFTHELTKEFSTKRSHGVRHVFGLRLKWGGDAEHDGEDGEDGGDGDDDFS